MSETLTAPIAELAVEIPWTVPKDWAGDRCFILCGGPSLKDQRKLVLQLRGRIIAIKQSVMLRPDADVMFVAGRDDPETCKDFYPLFRGTHIIARKQYPGFPAGVKFMSRTKREASYRLSTNPQVLAGLDAGGSAINLAYHFGATEIVMLGYDMTGGRWFNGIIKHSLPYPPQEHFDRHLASGRGIVKDLKRLGIPVWNTSKISKATYCDYRPLETFL